MALKNTSTTVTSLCSIPTLFLSLTLICTLSVTLFFLFSNPQTQTKTQTQAPLHHLKVYISDLPRSLNYGLLDTYYSSSTFDSRLPNNPHHKTHIPKKVKFPPYPENPLIKQYSAEYWIMADLMTPDNLRTNSFAKRVFDLNQADVVFVPFFATLSAELQLGTNKGVFRKKVDENKDYERQREVLDFVTKSQAWNRSGGRDHVFVLTGNVSVLSCS